MSEALMSEDLGVAMPGPEPTEADFMHAVAANVRRARDATQALEGIVLDWKRRNCGMCEGAGVVAANFGINSALAPAIVDCPVCTNV